MLLWSWPEVKELEVVEAEVAVMGEGVVMAVEDDPGGLTSNNIDTVFISIRVLKMRIQDKSQISFCKIFKCK